MPGRALSQAEILEVMTEISHEKRVWPSEDELKVLAQAVKDKLPYVVLSGMKYSIRYTTHFGNSVFIRPADTTAFIPCGYFTISKLDGMLV